MQVLTTAPRHPHRYVKTKTFDMMERRQTLRKTYYQGFAGIDFFISVIWHAFLLWWTIQVRRDYHRDCTRDCEVVPLSLSLSLSQIRTCAPRLPTRLHPRVRDCFPALATALTTASADGAVVSALPQAVRLGWQPTWVVLAVLTISLSLMTTILAGIASRKIHKRTLFFFGLLGLTNPLIASDGL
jgi:hypothetical protein